MKFLNISVVLGHYAVCTFEKVLISKHNGKSITLLAVNAKKNVFARVFVLVFSVEIANASAFVEDAILFAMQAFLRIQ